MQVLKNIIVLELATILLTAVQNSVGFTFKTSWTQAMDTCKNSVISYLPNTESDIMNNSIKNNSWLFNAKYMINKVVVKIGLKRMEEFDTCAENMCSKRNCTFCETSRQLNTSITSLQEFITEMIPGKIYVFGTYKSQVFPPPDRCKIYRNSQQQQYVNCNEPYGTYCREEENISKFRIIVFLESKVDDTTTPYVTASEKSLVPTTPSNTETCVHVNLRVNYKYIIAVSGFLLICILLNILCICCCVHCQVKRKMRVLKTEQIKENPCMPISDAITQIYKKMNDKEELNDDVYTYDLVADMGKKSNFTINGEMNDKAYYDRGFFRQVTQSGDYDMAWSNTWSSPASPDADYAQVQKISKLAMLGVAEENIYSKQRLPLEETIDGNSQAEDGDIVKMPLLNETSDEDNKDMKEHEKAVSIDKQDINVDDKDDQQENQEVKRATSAEDCQKNKTISSLRDNTFLSENSDKSINGNSEIGGKCLKEKNNRKCVKARKSNLDRKSKSRHASHREVYGNLPEKLDMVGNRKISAQKVAKMVDDTTEIVTNLNIVSSNTKL